MVGKPRKFWNPFSKD
jgi:hypothetical protein